jgi:hypothetical protein
MQHLKPFLLLTAFYFLLTFTSCKKDSFITSPSAQLHTSVDSLFYDTVFASAGSVTKSFKIFNDNSQKLKLSSVKLVHGSASAFKINVDGIAASEVDNIEIAANDSIYVFVQVNINPTSATSPFEVTDSVAIDYNGNEQFVKLIANGQNAHYIRCDQAEITSDTHWLNDLPYVILCPLHINEGVQLLIDPGCRIYVHATAPILVDGTLTVDGIKTDTVVFRGDRLDPDYKDLPASWPGIYFRRPSHDNRMTFTYVLNSFDAIVVDSLTRVPFSDPKLSLSDCKIDNAYEFGIAALNGSVHADNCLISNCGQNIVISGGGVYDFFNCTVASYSNLYIQHQYPVLQISDNNAGARNPLSATFVNCIFWGDNGSVTDEIVTNIQDPATIIPFGPTIYKGTSPPAGISFTRAVTTDPMFQAIDISHGYFNFRLQAGSPAINFGDDTVYYTDLDGNLHVHPFDLGCYESP